jgi:manganese transport protein
LLDDLLGTSVAPILFAVALIAAGQSSTITGTLAGQIVMEGYLRLRINPWIRRLITRLLAIIPACIVIYLFGDDEVDRLLVLSQVILSLQLGFAIIPLIHFVSEKRTMGAFTIKPIIQLLAWIIASILVYLNGRMVINEITELFTQTDNAFWKILVIFGAGIFIALLIYISFAPLFKKKKPAPSIDLHSTSDALVKLEAPSYRKIAIALDFSENDQKLLAHAIGQGKPDTHYLLIHVVESAAARFLGKDSDDYEARTDETRLNSYIGQLREKGFDAEAKLGFQNRTREIVRIIKENNADLLVIGAHGHSGLKDWIYGETVNSVRHELKIPVLVVNF